MARRLIFIYNLKNLIYLQKILNIYTVMKKNIYNYYNRK